MIISCPECSSEFDVPVALIGAEGRKVRCAKCKHEWHQTNPNIVESEDDDLEPVESPYKPLKEGVTATASEIDFDIDNASQTDEPIFAAPKSKVKKAKEPAIWTSRVFQLTLVLLCLILGGLYFAKNSSWAQKGTIGSAYKALGLIDAQKNKGAGIDRINLSLVQDGENYALEVKTSIINLSEKDVPLGALQAQVIGPDGEPLPQLWKFAPPKKILSKGERAPFNVTLDNVYFPNPEATYSVKLSFM